MPGVVRHCFIFRPYRAMSVGGKPPRLKPGLALQGPSGRDQLQNPTDTWAIILSALRAFSLLYSETDSKNPKGSQAKNHAGVPGVAAVIGAFTFPFAIGSVNLTSRLQPRTPLQNRRTLGRCVVRARRRPIPRR